MAKLLIEVDGGVITGVLSEVELDILIVDWDSLEGGGCPICGEELDEDWLCPDHGSESDMIAFVDNIKIGLDYHD